LGESKGSRTARARGTGSGPVIEELLTAPIVARDLRGSASARQGADLWPEEEALLRRAVSKRRGEFAGARWCARDALARLGMPPVPILPGQYGEPIWPPGVVGSMTHREDYCAAAVARADDVCAVGIDAEPNEPLAGTVLRSVALPAEVALLEAAASAGFADVHRDRLLFSAKESAYKAWCSLTGTTVDFRRVLIEFAAAAAKTASGTFCVTFLTTDRPAHSFTGSWLLRDGLVLTAVTATDPAFA
jgi:4'-phosphopantetheinyl transferase EntD